MRIRWETNETGAGERVVTVGNFDGVHLGHRAAIARLAGVARARSLVPTAVLFDPHPLAVLAPERAPERLTSIGARVELLRCCGATAVGVIEFDREVAQISPEAFVREVILGGLRARVVVASRGFGFGAGRRGDIALIRRIGREIGLDVEEVPAVREGGAAVSSTRVRERLRRGDVAGAARMLGRPHVVRGVVERGAGRGESLGFPTANLGPTEEMIPAEGIYAAWARWEDRHAPAAVHVGRRLTFDDVFTVEAYILDADEDLYGKTIEIGFLEWLREDRRFDGPRELAAQIARDVGRVREIAGTRLPEGICPYPPAHVWAPGARMP